MAQKAAKTLATRNTTTLMRTHLTTLTIHAIFQILRLILLTRSFTRYIILCAPALVLEFYLERLGRPTYTSSSNGNASENSLRSPGADLDAKGLTEYMWDILYWTWINLVLVMLFGDRAWWLYVVVPGYSVYLAATTVGGLRGMMSGMGAAGGEGEVQGSNSGSGSKRQAKMEKRGGQRAAYR